MHYTAVAVCLWEGFAPSHNDWCFNRIDVLFGDIAIFHKSIQVLELLTVKLIDSKVVGRLHFFVCPFFLGLPCLSCVMYILSLVTPLS